MAVRRWSTGSHVFFGTLASWLPTAAGNAIDFTSALSRNA